MDDQVAKFKTGCVGMFICACVLLMLCLQFGVLCVVYQAHMCVGEERKSLGAVHYTTEVHNRSTAAP